MELDTIISSGDHW